MYPKSSKSGWKILPMSANREFSARRGWISTVRPPRGRAPLPGRGRRLSAARAGGAPPERGALVGAHEGHGQAGRGAQATVAPAHDVTATRPARRSATDT